MAIHTTHRGQRRCHGDAGNAIVEFALTLPLIIVLLFGIVDFGFTFNDWIAVRQGGREGLRQALVDTHTPGGKDDWSCDTDFSKDTPLPKSDAMNMVCFTKSRVGLDDKDTRVKIFGTDFHQNQPVKVCVQYKVSSFSGLFATFFENKVLFAQAESLLEKDAPNMRPVEETPLGTKWADSCKEL